MNNSYISSIKATARTVHDFIYNNIKLSDQEHAIFIAGSLIALQDNKFRKHCKEDDYATNNEANRFINEMMEAIKSQIEACKGFDKPDKRIIILEEFSFIKRNEQLKKIVTIEKRNWVAVQYLLNVLEKGVYDIAKKYPQYDILGAFYDQFTKYSASDQQSLGIVLTPHHAAQFMSDLLEINENDVVLDTCCGSASLLLTAGGAAKQSIGVELNSRMAAISLANMIIKELPTYIWLGNSFDEEIKEEIKTYKPTKLIINPPYSQQDKELSFIENGLDLLQPGGMGVAIMPVSCANKGDSESKFLRKSILSKHKLIASFIMPEQLFAPMVGVNTIICLFEAYSAKKDPAFLAYIKDDGFELTKSEGRIDKNNKWPNIKNEFMTLYNNRQEENKKSVIVDIKNDDEWSLISHMIIHEDVYPDEFFIPHIQSYLMYLIQGGSKNV